MSFIHMSLTASVMIGVIALIRILWMNKLPKRVFLILWLMVLIRLMVPFYITSPISIYSVFTGTKEAAEEYSLQPVNNSLQPVNNSRSDIPQTQILDYSVRTTADPGADKLNLPLLVWILGAITIAAYFSINYIRCLREYKMSLPVRNPFVFQWLQGHRIRRKIEVRQSERTKVPLTYGIYRPVILLPKNTDWKNEERLKYVLMHEFIHIRYFDNLLKLVLALVLCIHWFNPLVWLMFLLINKDIELACDETVVRNFGSNSKASYALALIGMEEEKSLTNLLISNFNKNSMEERIKAIMKMKKFTKFTFFVAIVMIISIPAVFATSADKKNSLAAVPETSYTKEEYKMLEALQFKGYQEMKLEEYRNKLLKKVDTNEYVELLNRIRKDENLKRLRFTNETADFLVNTVIPLLNEDWKAFRISDSVGDLDMSSGGLLEYTIEGNILEEKVLTVKEFSKSFKNIVKDIAEMKMNGKKLNTDIDLIKSKWSDKSIQYNILYYYRIVKPDYLYPEQVIERVQESVIQQAQMAERERLAKSDRIRLQEAATTTGGGK